MRRLGFCGQPLHEKTSLPFPSNGAGSIGAPAAVTIRAIATVHTMAKTSRLIDWIVAWGYFGFVKSA